MAQSAGTVGGGNEGQTDMGRGTTFQFSYSKSGRKTGRVAGAPAVVANAGRLIRKASDPRLA